MNTGNSTTAGASKSSSPQSKNQTNKPTVNHSTSTQSAAKNTKKKQSIETSSPSPLNFINMFLLYVLKRYIFPATHVKIGLYVIALIVLSVLKDFHVFQGSFYLASKNSIFNKYFVKIGWAWTLLVCVPFILMTSLVYTGRNMSQVTKHSTRLIVSTFLWYFFTTLFDYIDSKTGVCKNKMIKTKTECKLNKYAWEYGFDISGHTFILMHGLFLMLEEVKVFSSWEQLNKKINDKLSQENNQEYDQAEISYSSDNPHVRARYYYNLLTPYIKLNFFFMALLAALWEAMLFVTFLYYHEMLHKLLAAFIAIVSWFITYKKWYLIKESKFSPGLPGEGLGLIKFEQN